MFKYIFLLALLTTANCQTEDSEDSGEEVEDLPPLPTPKLRIITTFNSTGKPGFTVEWAPVVSDEKNPVAGFKASVWENEKEKIYHTEKIEGLGEVWIVNYRTVEKDFEEIPNTEPIVQTVGANETKARFENMKLKEDYQIRVQAFNDLAEDGPYSNVLGIKMGAE